MKIKSVKSINQLESVIQTSYDIITKGHGGQLVVESIGGEVLPVGQTGSTFLIILAV